MFVYGHIDNALADLNFLISQTLIVDPDDLRNELSWISLFEHQYSPVHRKILCDEVHDVIEEFVERFVEKQRFVDFIDNGQRSMFQLDLFDIDRSGGSTDGSADIMFFENIIEMHDSVDVSRRGRGIGDFDIGGDLFVKDYASRSDKDFIPLFQLEFSRDAFAVDKSPIFAVVVPYRITMIDRIKERMVARAKWIRKRDVIIG